MARHFFLSAWMVTGMMLAQPALASTYTYSFDRITSNASTDIADQLSMEVSQTDDSVIFTFYNNVGVTSSITDIYFDLGDTDLFRKIQMYTDSGTGVSFDSKATPKNLPGGKTIDFTADFSGDSNRPGVAQNGVNAVGEWVSFAGTLGSGMSFEGLLASLSTGEFRVGMRLQSILGTYSDGFVNAQAIPQVPLPGAIWLFGTALAGYGFARRNRRK